MKGKIDKNTLDRYVQGTASEDERLLIEAWYLELARKNELPAYPNDLEDKMNKALPVILSHAQFRPASSKRRLWFALSAAAAILTVFIFFYWIDFSDPKDNVLVNKPLQDEIVPGSDKAYLTLSNGTKIALDERTTGNIAQEANVRIKKSEDGELTYELIEANENVHAEEVNLLQTPNGGQYQVTLPDGSKVWLNAASSLRYPSSFAGRSERKVSLTGEGYFEIAKDKAKPFVVESNGQKIEVLGTKFNLNAYTTSHISKTTLLEGSIKLSATGTSESYILQPGQQLRKNGQSMRILHIDTEESVAWKNGYFSFSGKTLEEGMQEIARWYDVDIVYQGTKLKAIPLAGTISKYDKLATILKTLELTGSFNFQIEGRKVVVSLPK
ncbi:DUF4974 domain-containing protein [Sphingobacterium olei]|uniref:DUF4974 domain-containing protein n=1 Tax=Sphingobacterium olei TaxID=2571155 RepID=A0A4V5MKL3_9SPHI|nr:FecR family protein [Sphingobacterium olei]TJZ53728.1 DUF4974 domain-containing protein [Sphingobacterium olei]